jgi:uncharacterized membrane protein
MTAATQETKRSDEWQQRGPYARYRDEWDGATERQRQGESGGTERLARALGWFSLGLGLAEVVAPRAMARMIGVNDTDSTRNALIGLGLREIASGVGILTQPQAAGWLWTWVGGDVMDLALLGTELRSDTADRNRVAMATAAVLGVTVLDVIAGRRLSEQSDGGARNGAGATKRRGVHVTRSITVNRSPEEIYTFWRNFENLPRFMDHLESVRVLGERRSHWKAKAPAGTSVEWDAEILDDVPSQLISWRSTENADVPNAGSVHFVPAPGGRGTEVHVELQYNPPGGAVGAAVAKLFGEEPGQQIGGDLRRFKQVIETGEVVHSDASIHRGMHPARPPADQM